MAKIGKKNESEEGEKKEEPPKAPAREPDEKSEEKSSGGSKKMLIIAIAGFGLFVLLSAGGLLYWMISSVHTEASSAHAVSELVEGVKTHTPVTQEEKSEEQKEKTDTDKPQEAIYLEIEPNFVVKLRSEGERAIFLQAGVAIVSRDNEVIKAARKNIPLIKNDLIIYYSSMKPDEILSIGSKDILQQGSLKIVNRVLKKYADAKEAEEVIFTSFVVQ